MLPTFAYIKARSLDEAFEHLDGPKARIHAGGTDLQGCMRDGVFETERVVSISGLSHLKGIRERADGGLAIGALTTIDEIATNPVILDRYPALAQAAGEVASPQLRNQGTIGGNLCQRPRCWYFRGDFHCRKKGGPRCYALHGENRYHAIFGGGPCHIVHPSDTAPALIALGASVRIADDVGERIEPLSHFFILPAEDVTRENILQPGEIVTEVLLPRTSATSMGMRSSYRKVRERGAFDFALASVALALKKHGSIVQEANVVLGGVAPIPWRAVSAETVLVGSRVTPATAPDIAEAAVEGADPMEQNAYKVLLVKGIIEESLLGMVG